MPGFISRNHQCDEIVARFTEGGKEREKDVVGRGTRTKIRREQQTEVLLACSQDPEGAAAQGPRGGAPSLCLGVDQQVYICRKEVCLGRFIKDKP